MQFLYKMECYIFLFFIEFYSFIELYKKHRAPPRQW